MSVNSQFPSVPTNNVHSSVQNNLNHSNNVGASGTVITNNLVSEAQVLDKKR